MPKKRGGQPGNRNAWKHGFYSKYFSPFDIRALSDIPVTAMTGELGVLRLSVDRFMEAYTASLKDLDYEERLAALRFITLAVGRIAALERLQSSAVKNLAQYDEFMQMFHDIPAEILEEMDRDPD